MNVATCLPFKIDGTLCISQSNGPGIVACGVLSHSVSPSSIVHHTFPYFRDIY